MWWWWRGGEEVDGGGSGGAYTICGCREGSKFRLVDPRAPLPPYFFWESHSKHKTEGKWRGVR